MTDHRVLSTVRSSSRGTATTLWAVFDRDNDAAISRQLSDIHALPLHAADQPNHVQAPRLHQLNWVD